MLGSKLGRLLLAMRDKEDRVRFSGYDVASFKVFVFCAAAMFSAIGGPCSRCRWASCRRPSSASCRPSRW
jgi:ABC-type branched-subunit amino acid transport system permease subunit